MKGGKTGRDGVDLRGWVTDRAELSIDCQELCFVFLVHNTQEKKKIV